MTLVMWSTYIKTNFCWTLEKKNQTYKSDRKCTHIQFLQRSLKYTNISVTIARVFTTTYPMEIGNTFLLSSTFKKVKITEKYKSR